jgi:D-galactarolactone cycloisomerase
VKIVHIDAYHVGFAPEPALGNASLFIRRRDFMLVALQASDGTTGWGEVFASPYAAGAFLKSNLASTILGQPAQNIGRIWHDMVAKLGYDRRGAAMMAVSAVDMALHDLVARLQGISVAELLGGAIRQQIPAYASGPFLVEGPDPYEAYPAKVETLLRRGFRAIKPRAGVTPHADGLMVSRLRDVMGPEPALMVDINQGYTAAAAIDSARRMEAAGLLWIEEPVQPEDIPGYQAVARAAPCAIAGGEALASLAAFRDFLQAGAFAILQPDLTVCGGFTGFRKITALAEAFGVPVMPHVFGTIVNFAAALQAASVLAPRKGGGPFAYPFIEYDVTPNPLLALLGAPPVGADGTVALPEEPGIGISLSPERLSPWLVDHWHVALD